MKYRVTVLLSLLAFGFVLLGSMDTLRAADSRGDKQFTFTTDDRGGFPTLSPDSPAAKFKEEHRTAEENRERSISESTQEFAPPPNQQAGQAANETRGREARVQLGEEEDPIRSQAGIDELRLQNQTTGQTSNIPGTTGTSPNGTSNLFGTKGIPIVPQIDDRRDR